MKGTRREDGGPVTRGDLKLSIVRAISLPRDKRAAAARVTRRPALARSLSYSPSSNLKIVLAIYFSVSGGRYRGHRRGYPGGTSGHRGAPHRHVGDDE